MVIHPMSCESKNDGYINPVKMYWWPSNNIGQFTEALDYLLYSIGKLRFANKTPIFRNGRIIYEIFERTNQPANMSGCQMVQVVQRLQAPILGPHQPKTIRKTLRNLVEKPFWDGGCEIPWRVPAWCIHPEDPIFHPQKPNCFPGMSISRSDSRWGVDHQKQSKTQFLANCTLLRLFFLHFDICWFKLWFVDVGDTSQLLTIC